MSGWTVVEHWTSGEPHTWTHREIWLVQRVDPWSNGYAVRYRWGGPGKPLDHKWCGAEADARAEVAARMEAAKELHGGAEWHLSDPEQTTPGPGHTPTSSSSQ